VRADLARLRPRSATAIGVVVVLVAVVALAILGPILWGHRADEVDLRALSEGSSAAHPFGTDELGRDMLARTLVATRLSLSLAVVIALLGFVAGMALGMLPVVLGRRLRRVVANVIGWLVAFPGLLLALLVATIVGVGAKGAVIALAAAMAPPVARLTQTLAASVGGSDYVAAARVVGVGRRRLLLRHVLPNIAPPMVLQFALATASALIALSALSFLGLGVQQPSYDWGALLTAGLDRIYVTPAAALGPAAAIVIASLAINVGGDLLAARLAPEGRGSHRQRRAARAAIALAPAASVDRADARALDESAALVAQDLTVSFPGELGVVTPLRDVSLQVRPGERVGIVGESGSGKSLTALALADLIEPPGKVTARTVAFAGEDSRRRSPRERARLLIGSLALVFQDPLSSLNPAIRVGRQLTEAVEIHHRTPRARAREQAIARLRQLRIAAAARRMHQFPHELSGGMRQRAVIAMGLMTQPRIIIADEPTTALDVTVERQVLRVLRKVNEEQGTAIVLISHDISVIAGFCERVLVMYAGRIVEEIDAASLRDRAAHPYTRALMAAVPDMDTDRERPLATIPGRPPRVDEVAQGCPFAPRCAFATQRCSAERPPLADHAGGARVACWHPQHVVAEEQPTRSIV
jgi:oligopeptide/dipeptide ABC transporter ATP-binding protein